MKGRRLPDNTRHGNGVLYEPGDYVKITEYGQGIPVKTPEGFEWWCVTPNGLHGNLRVHAVIEHEDGTITVSPSILCKAPGLGEWHGYLERGVWRSC